MLSFVFFSQVNYSQPVKYTFRQITPEQGLPGTNIKAQFQDHNGIMWISVEAIGLCRYDGHKFDLFRNDPLNKHSISSNFINDITEDKNGDLWIATDDGLNLFNRETVTFKRYYTNKNDAGSLSDNVINTVYFDSKDNLWIGTGNGISVLMRGSKSFTRYLYSRLDDTNSAYNVFSFYEHNDGNFWIGTNQGLVKYEFSHDKFIQWRKTGKSDNEPIHNRISEIKEDKSGDLWLATHRGLDRFNIKTEKFAHWKYQVNDLTDLGQEGINTIYVHSDSSVWVGTYTKGIVIINPKKNSYLRLSKDDNNENYLQSNHILYITSDNTGMLWIGTKFGGIFKYISQEGIFQIPSKYVIFEKLTGKHILSFFSENDNIFWVGSKFEGLYRVDRISNRVDNYSYKANNPNGLASNRVQAILRDSKNNLWIGTEGGLDLFDENSGNFIHYSSITINYLIEDNLGTIWVGTTTGIFKVNKTLKTLERYSFTKFKEFFLNENLEILYILHDSKNYLWFSTRYNGLYRYHPVLNEYFHFEKNNLKGSLTDNMVRPIYEDKNGTIWVGTKSGGLHKFDWKTNHFSTVTVNDGLPSNFILGIEQDNDGNLWLGTNNGLTKYNPNTKAIINFNKDNGLRSNIIEIGLNYHFKSGELLFGGNDGFNIFQPANIIKPDKKIQCILTSVKVFDKQIASDIESDKRINLKHNENYLSFEFTLTDFNNPFRHQYYCFMEGIDKKWKNLGNRNYITYTNLESGTYFFYIKGLNELGTWTQNPIKITITIKPAYYETWWFRIGVTIFILCIIIVFNYYKTLKIKSAQRFLETQIKERTQKLEDAYQELLQKNSMIEEQKKEIEAHRSSLENTIHERTKDLEIAKERAEESDRLKSSFLANMSHEIRTPLNAITGFSMLLNDNLDSEIRKKYQQIININTQSLLKLIEDILDLSKIEAGQFTLKSEVFDLNSLMQELFVMFSEEYKFQKKESIQFFCANNINEKQSVSVRVDPFRFRQIFVNLIGNAFKYTHIGEISYGYRIFDNDLEIFVKDSGIGISQKDQEVIFNRFVKVEDDGTLYRGSGLGLSIVKSITGMMGGKLKIDSELNKGSVFYCKLPNIVVSSTSNKANGNLIVNENSNLSGKQILIVEDEDSNMQLLHSFLNKSAATIFEATNGLQAIEICRSNKIDLVLLDIKMPIMNGFDTIKVLRNEYPTLPIIAQTAYAMADDRRKILDAGFNDYIAKPILIDQLFEKIYALLVN